MFGGILKFTSIVCVAAHVIFASIHPLLSHQVLNPSCWVRDARYSPKSVATLHLHSGHREICMLVLNFLSLVESVSSSTLSVASIFSSIFVDILPERNLSVGVHIIVNPKLAITINH